MKKLKRVQLLKLICQILCLSAMEQMNIPKEMIVEVEYTGAAIALHPIVFKDGDSYCCLLGPDPMTGVFGCGDTPKDALEDWEDSLKTYLERAPDNDEVVAYVRNAIFDRVKHKAPEGSSDKVKEFYDQFRPGKRKQLFKKLFRVL